MSKLTDILELFQAKTVKAATYDSNPSPQLNLNEAEAAINAYIAEIIGEDERAAGELDSDYRHGELNGRNELRAEQRKRAGL